MSGEALPEASVSADAPAASAGTPVLRVRDLKKTYVVGFMRKKVEAVRGVSFEVRPGEIFGLLGPNGAGKTTTIKSILRLVHPSSGSIELFGGSPADPDVRAKVGYMPENPYVYQYLTPREFLDLCGRLVGMGKKERRDRAEAMIDQVKLRHAADRPIGKFSKGMMQRVGLAQAPLHDPQLLVLDEPMSGLDPIGRKEVRDVLLAQRDAGKTLLFTSHVLSDVEVLCDRVVILRSGLVRASGELRELVRAEVERYELELADVADPLEAALAPLGELVRHPARLHLTLGERADVDRALALAMEHGAHVVALRPQQRSLEELFVEQTTDAAAP